MSGEGEQSRKRKLEDEEAKLLAKIDQILDKEQLNEVDSARLEFYRQRLGTLEKLAVAAEETKRAELAVAVAAEETKRAVAVAAEETKRAAAVAAEETKRAVAAEETKRAVAAEETRRIVENETTRRLELEPCSSGTLFFIAVVNTCDTNRPWAGHSSAGSCSASTISVQSMQLILNEIGEAVAVDQTYQFFIKQSRTAVQSFW